MLCDNCKKKGANVRYSENINGRKREMNLCETCSEKLGIGNINLSMPIDFSSFLGDFFEDFTRPEFMPLFDEVKTLKCNNCGYTFEDIANTGKFGCETCYETFENRINSILKRIQGSNRHVGRIGKDIDNKINEKMIQEEKKECKETNNQNNIETHKLEKLQEDLKQAIKEERYEDAAKIRDEIKKLEN